jgi:serine/threonine protein kinase/CHASE2 domain-containing sensor protein
MSIEILSRYEILGSLGKGGMGEVLKARDLQLRRMVAIKRLLPGTLGDEEARARFLREARLAAQLNHPNIATIYDIIVSDGETLIVMEYIEGETIRDHATHGPLPLAEVLDLGVQIASALAAAHKQAVIHRDIKSENIKVTPEGFVKVLDFGLAKKVQAVDPTIEETVQAESIWVTQQGFAAGTPGYTAPEQWKGDPVDGRADIFSFGVVLYEMLTGRAPFPGQSIIERITATIHNDPEPVTNFAHVPAQLERIVRKALAKDPNQRFQGMSELQQELEQLKQHLDQFKEGPKAGWEPVPATLAGRYRILAELGQGGMGKVYKARDLKLDRIVAIKELRQGILADDKARARFMREASLLAQLNHRNIATVHDIIEEESQIFIIMEFIEGDRLLDKIKRGPLPSEEVYQLAMEVAEALAEAHSRRIIHRDIKSANIMMNAGGHAKVLDFGLAKRMEPSDLSPVDHTQTIAAELTGTRVTFGTPKYMSPEQRLTADVDERSDIFSYGVVLCEMLVGEVPFMGEVVAELLQADPSAWPSPINRLPLPWRPIVKKSLAKDLQQRYQNVADLITDLKKITAVAGVAVTEPGTGVVERPLVREMPRVVPTLAVSIGGLAPALLFLHLASASAQLTEGFVYLVMAMLAPGAVFLLQRLVPRRSKRIHQWLTGLHQRTLSFMYLNLVFVLLSAYAFSDFVGVQSWGDWRYAINDEPALSDITLVAIDEPTRNYFQGRQEILNSADDLLKLRKYHPQVLEHLAHYAPKVIAFDLFFTKQSEFDDQFAAALSKVQSQGIPIVIGQDFNSETKNFNETNPKIRQALGDETSKVWFGHPIALSGLKDDVVRVVPVRIRRSEGQDVFEKTEDFPSISLLMATGGKYDWRWPLKNGVLQASNLSIPIDTSVRYVKNLPVGKYHFEYDNLLINFPTEPFRTVSYADVYAGKIEPDLFQNKYVLIGSGAAQFEPFRQVPNDFWSPYKIHASALNTILRKSYIIRITGLPGFLVLLFAAYLVLALAIKSPARSRLLVAGVAGVCLILFGAAFVLFKAARIWFDTDYAMMASLVTGLLTYWKRG